MITIKTYILFISLVSLSISASTGAAAPIAPYATPHAYSGMSTNHSQIIPIAQILAQIALEPSPEECGVGAECKPSPDPVTVDQADTAPANPLAKSIPSTAPASETTSQMSADENNALDLAFWSSIEDSDNPVLFKAYLKRFPHGVFAPIATEKLKKLGAKPATTFTPAPKSAPTIQSSKLTLSKKGLGDITAQTPFTIAAIKKALPGFNVHEEQRPLEEGSLTVIVVDTNDGKKIVISVVGEDIQNIITSSPSTVGPHGLRIGDSFERVIENVPLSKCFRDVYMEIYDSEDTIGCFTEDDIISYWFKLPVPQGSEEEDLNPASIPGTAIMSEMSWNRPYEDDTPDVSTKPTPPPAANMDTNLDAQQLVQQGDRILNRTYQLDVSLWDVEAAKALKLYRQAAELGSAIAYYKIGFLYETGNGIAKDNNVAIRYYEKAAAKGHLDAFSQIILVQNQFKNYKGAAKTFFRLYRVDSTMALRDADGASYGVARAIQRAIRIAGYYSGPIDGDIGPGTRKAIAAYISGAPKPAASGDDTALPALAAKLQRQLQRVGCYQGAIDGQWGSGSARAMRNFNHWAGKNLPINKPTGKALRTVSAKREAVCGVD